MYTQLETLISLAIGLILVFFLTSLIASSIKELIANLFAWRGSYLVRALDVMLSNDRHAAFRVTGIADFMKLHFLPVRPDALPPKPVLNGVATVDQSLTLAQVTAVRAHPLLTGNPDAVPSYISPRNFALAMMAVLRDGSQAPIFTQMENTIGALPPGRLRTLLATFVHAAEGDTDRFRLSLEHWFDDVMDRLSGIYQRTARYALIVIGLLLAVALNIDAVRICHYLILNPAAASALVEQAARQVAPPDSAAKTDAHADTNTVAQQISQVHALPIPIGWASAPGDPNDFWPDESYSLRLAGFLVTAAATSLGASFWFNLMQNLLGIRGAVKPKKASDDDVA